MTPSGLGARGSGLGARGSPGSPGASPTDARQIGALLRAAAAAAVGLLCAGPLGDCGAAAALRVAVEPAGGDMAKPPPDSELLLRAEALAVASASMALALLAGAFQGAHAAALRSQEPRGRRFRPQSADPPEDELSEDQLLQLALAPSPGGSEC